MTETGRQEHILACLSSSPSNARIVRTAATMAKAFGGSFTALYVQTPAAENMNPEDRERLDANMRLAEKLGAEIAVVTGTDVPRQIAEYARVSGTTKIVIGRNIARRRHFPGKPTLTDALIGHVPNLDIHVIPDPVNETEYRRKPARILPRPALRPRDLLVTFCFLAGVTLLGMVLLHLGLTEANIIPIYILGVLLTALFTEGNLLSVAASVLSVVLFNYFFTEPKFTFHAYEPGYPVTFAILLAVSLITGTLAARLKEHAAMNAQAAYRTGILFDTEQMLVQAGDDADILRITAEQLMKLLKRDVVVYPEESGKLGEPYLVAAQEEGSALRYRAEEERAAAQIAFEEKKRAGAYTERRPEAACQYLAIRIHGKAFGVFGIARGERALDAFENSVALSMVDECALAMENRRNAREKEGAALLAQNEQMRANLLRAISHDLRTPLTSISGNAGNLLTNGEKMEEESRRQALTDIYEDSQWLIRLVENLLSVTRIEDGKIPIHTEAQLVEDVITEALAHVSPEAGKHRIRTVYEEEYLLAEMDARLIMQVIINLVNNAAVYTPEGSEIVVRARRTGSRAEISVADDGPGIPEEQKEKVFEMFYTGEKGEGARRRGLGLGLPLCRSILHAHGSEITLENRSPHGCIFSFTLPCEEVAMQ